MCMHAIRGTDTEISLCGAVQAGGGSDRAFLLDTTAHWYAFPCISIAGVRIFVPFLCRNRAENFGNIREYMEINGVFLGMFPNGSSPLNRGEMRLERKWGSSHTLLGNAPQPHQEDGHGPHHRMLPQWGVPCQRPKRSGQHWHPLAQGQAVNVVRSATKPSRPRKAPSSTGCAPRQRPSPSW